MKRIAFTIFYYTHMFTITTSSFVKICSLPIFIHYEVKCVHSIIIPQIHWISPAIGVRTDSIVLLSFLVDAMPSSYDSIIVPCAPLSQLR